ncbi:5'-nucleotidase SurE [Lacunisphaera limnophila]|uniref:5'-nucleotidase n=1 Tax=Lacunisphaera limnophila TaxID=1838286 RepID=A0A1D8AVD5_9BACT|nr:5'/3'-nucleotidase SurE [Lacunisphaera limnophila]AOS44860.1 5'-nucleotidase SurE [Lacunisphaera limnophila]
MRLLVTNDDGINSVFLHELIFALKAAGHELFVVAPASEQSWTGASKTRGRPVKSAAVDRGFGCPTWIVDGTPSDCVNIALAHLLPKQDATGPEQTTCVEGVVSGINVGFNCTLAFIIASGTVAGAWEGALHGLPAMALSQDVSEETYYRLKEHGSVPEGELLATLRISATHAARLATELLATTPPRSFTVHNVNFPHPCRPDSELRRTVPAHFFVPGLFTPADDQGRHQLIWTEGEDVSPPEPLTDLKCLEAGAISHTVLDYRKLGHS